MKDTAAFVLSRTSDLVTRFRSKPRMTSVAFARTKVKGSPRATRASTEDLVRKLMQPVTRRQDASAFQG